MSSNSSLLSDKSSHSTAVSRAIEESSISDKTAALQRFTTLSEGKSNTQAREIANDILGAEVAWNWDCERRHIFTIVYDKLTLTLLVPRTREGYYHYAGGVDAAVSRVLAYAPYSDLLWLETKTPDLEQARSFARRIRAKYPGK